VCLWSYWEPTDPDNGVIADFHTHNWTACATVGCWETSVLPVAAKARVIGAEFGETNAQLPSTRGT
jgi:endoglucanase